MKRRELVKMLVGAGWVPFGGTKHEKFCKGGKWILVKRHGEIDDTTAKKILRQAGLR